VDYAFIEEHCWLFIVSQVEMLTVCLYLDNDNALVSWVICCNDKFVNTLQKHIVYPLIVDPDTYAAKYS